MRHCFWNRNNSWRRGRGTINETRNKFFSLSNNAGTIWSGNLTFTQSGEKRKKRIARVRNFRRRILDFRTNIEQFSCRKKCDGYWTRIWWRANIKVLRRIKILGGGKNIDRVRLQTYSSEKARVHRPFRHNLVNKRGRILFIMACATMEVTSDRTV